MRIQNASIRVYQLVTVFLFTLSGAVQAQFTFVTNANNTIAITGYIGNPTALIVPSTTNGYPVTSTKNGAFSSLQNLTTITFPSSITNLGNGTFVYCYNLTRVYFLGNAPSLGGGDVFFQSGSPIVYYMPGTTGWSSSLNYRPTVLWNPQAQSGSFSVQTNQFGFDITGSSNLVIVVEASTNLTSPLWSPISTNTLNTFVGTNGTSYFSDPQWTNYTKRFYRFRSP